jgi:hypothetical protein
VAWGNAGYVTACSQYDEQAQSEYLLVLDSWDGRNWWTNRVDEPISAPNYLVDGSITALDYADGRFVAVGPGGLVLRSQPLVYLGEPRLDANGSLTVWFEGQGGREYTVEGTADLETWTAVGTVRPSLSAQEIAWPVEAVGHQFYRLRAVE